MRAAITSYGMLYLLMAIKLINFNNDLHMNWRQILRKVSRLGEMLRKRLLMISVIAF